MDNFADKIKNTYNSKELSENQLSTLMNLQNSKQPFFSFFKISTALAILAIGVFSSFYFNSTDNLTKIAKEVIYNHKKNLPAEFLVNKMTDLNARLTKLDFKIINSNQLSDYLTVGGRYCSIQGSTAAQIRLKNGNKVSTLYQSDFLDVDITKLPFKIIKGGVSVLIWIENDILFTLATDIN